MATEGKRPWSSTPPSISTRRRSTPTRHRQGGPPPARPVRQALSPEDDVTEAFPSGSLARGSQLEPIHDVDFVVVYDPDAFTLDVMPELRQADGTLRIPGRHNRSGSPPTRRTRSAG